MGKNLMGKSRKVNDPYEIYVAPGWEWRILKHNQSPEGEAKNPYASCFCAVQGSGTFGGYDMGDTYIKDFTSYGTLLTEDEKALHLAENPWRQY